MQSFDKWLDSECKLAMVNVERAIEYTIYNDWIFKLHRDFHIYPYCYEPIDIHNFRIGCDPFNN